MDGPNPKNSETFVRAPKRRTEPSYYEIVTDPIDMLRIQQKLKMDEYTNMEELKADFELLFKNALSYYKKGTQEFKDATEMGELFAKALGRLVLHNKAQYVANICSFGFFCDVTAMFLQCSQNRVLIFC